MIWLYRIASIWGEEDNLSGANVYLFNAEKEIDINEQSHWILIQSIEEKIKETKQAIEAYKKNLNDGETEINVKLLGIGKDNKKIEKIQKINLKQATKSLEKNLEQLQFISVGLDDRDGYDINKDNFVITVKKGFSIDQLLDYIKIFIVEIFDDNIPMLNEGDEADFAGTNQDSVTEMYAKAELEKLKKSGILKMLEDE